jgi:hypothetical protein
MNSKEKIRRQWMMLSKDLFEMRRMHLIRLMKNKRLPLSERYAALMHIQGQTIAPDSSDESMLREIIDCLKAIDSESL